MSVEESAVELELSLDLAICMAERAVYVDYYEADQGWRRASEIGSSNEDYLEAAERLDIGRQAVQKLRGE